jgi:hypothetical protein
MERIMNHYKLVVISSPAPGSSEEEYNRWYEDEHLGDVLKVEGIVAAERFKATSRQPEIGARMARYLAIYEIETDDLEAVVADLESRAGTEVMMISDTLDVTSTGAMIYESTRP